MHKDTVTAPMEPFTSDEETALYERLDRLSAAELASYIGSAKSSLGNRALNPTWRPRVELALKHAELAQVREEAAAALAAAAPPAAEVAAVAKPKKAPKAKAAKVDEAADTSTDTSEEAEEE